MRVRGQNIYLGFYAALSLLFLLCLVFAPEDSLLGRHHYLALTAFALLFWGGRFLPFPMGVTGKTLANFPQPPVRSRYHDYSGQPCPRCQSLRTLPEPMQSVRPYHCLDCDCHFRESGSSRRYRVALWQSLGFFVAGLLILVWWPKEILWVLALVLFWILTVSTTLASMKPEFVVRD